MLEGGTHRLPGLDGLRGVAGVGVVLVHAWMYTGSNDPAKSPLLDGLIGELRLGLMAFFVMSAFLLFSPWVSAARQERPVPHTGRFFRRRAARILPGWWAAILGAFVLLAAVGSARAADAAQLPLFAVFAQNHFDATRSILVPPGWSLAVEVTFYALLPAFGWLLLRVARRHGVRRATFAISGALAVAGLAFNLAAELRGWPQTVTTSLLTFLPIFACGMAAAALPAPGSAAARRRMLAAGWALVVACGVWHADGTGLAGHVLRDLPAGIGFGLIVVALCAGPPGLLELAPIRWLGTVSYGTYLWHMPVLFSLKAQGRLPDTVVPAFLAVLLPALALAAVSWYAIERPVLRRAAGRRRERSGKRPARPLRPAYRSFSPQ